MTEKTWRILGIFVVLLGWSVAIIPKFIFPICEADHLVFLRSYQPTMRCYWFGQIEIVLGLLVIPTGLIVLYQPDPNVRLCAGVMLIGLGLAAIAVSTNLIIGSTCGHLNSLCQTGTKPAERIAGALVIIVGLGLVLPLHRRSTQR